MSNFKDALERARDKTREARSSLLALATAIDDEQRLTPDGVKQKIMEIYKLLK